MSGQLQKTPPIKADEPTLPFLEGVTNPFEGESPYAPAWEIGGAPTGKKPYLVSVWTTMGVQYVLLGLYPTRSLVVIVKQYEPSRNQWEATRPPVPPFAMQLFREYALLRGLPELLPDTLPNEPEQTS